MPYEQFDEIQLKAETHLLVNESTTLADGTPHLGRHPRRGPPRRLGFKPSVSWPIVNGAALIPADKSTTPTGDLELSLRAGQATTVTLTTVDVFLYVSLDPAGARSSLITLDAATAGQNTTLGDLVTDIKEALAASPLGSDVRVRLDGDRVQFFTKEAGSTIFLGIQGWSISTAAAATTFSEGGSVVRNFSPIFNEGALGFVSDFTFGADRSYVVAQLPMGTWTPTTGPQALLLTDAGQIITGIDFGSLDVNDPPTVELTDTITTLPENSDTSSRVPVAVIEVTDDAMGSHVLSLSGADAGLFEIEADVLYLRAGTLLDFETQSQLSVTVEINDDTVGATPDDAASLTISVQDVNESPMLTLTGTLTTLPRMPTLPPV